MKEKSQFEQLRQLIREFVHPPLEATIDKPDYYEVWSKKTTSFKDKAVGEVFFLSAVFAHGQLSLHFNPIFTIEELTEIFSNNLLDRFDGKSTILVKHLNLELKRDIAAAIMKIHNYYLSKGWI